MQTSPRIRSLAFAGSMQRTCHNSPSTDFSPVLRPKKSSLLNSQRSRRKLAHQPSKLDLIDDTTLTSLPFAPPPPRTKVCRSFSATSEDSKAASEKLPENVLLPVSSANSNQSVHTATLQEYNATICDEADETMEDPEEPIVLVEDYLCNPMAESEISQRLNRKKSLATFKQRYYSKRSLSNLSESTHLNKRSRSDQSPRQHVNTSEDLEAIFGKLPGADRLKHCLFCNKPLYEISSIINNTGHLAPLAGQQNLVELYNEFVCWDCTDVYEQFMSELNSNGEHQLHVSTTETAPLVHMLNSFRACEASHHLQPPKKQSKRAFSPDLLSRLHYLSSISELTSGASWLDTFVMKFKWSKHLECFPLHCPMRENNIS